MAGAVLEKLKGREREARRSLILESAKKLFSEKDFRKVTVREIARETGISPGTIYRYYENLDDLFLAVFFSGAREISELIDQRCPPGSGIHRFCDVYVDYLNENMTFFNMMSHFMLGGSLSSDKAEELNPVMRELMDRIRRILDEAGISGSRRLTAQALFSALNGIMISYAHYPGRTPEEIRAHTLRLAGEIAGFFEGKNQ
jgi:AcrR family transcriptional regulator